MIREWECIEMTKLVKYKTAIFDLVLHKQI